jgi:trans-2,3-dihydro-3-hydroxyanthranilate isomerase
MDEKEMIELDFNIVDVFAESKFGGNQLAVFKNTHSLKTEEMQQIAKEMNYSETTFILSDEKRNEGYDVRIFTPQTELPFAGHPTLGTAYVIQKELIKSQEREIKLNLKIGQIPVTLNYKNNHVDTLWMKQKSPIFGNKYGRDGMAEILGLDFDDIEESYPICEVSTGTFCFIVPLKTLSAVKKASIDLKKFYKFIKTTQAKTILIFAKETLQGKNDLHVRFFAHYLGVPEDPATGSANGCLAAYLVKYKYFGTKKIDVRVEQGFGLGRPSILLLEAEEKEEEISVRVGGRVFMIASGKLFL